MTATPARRPRRPSLPIEPAAAEEIDASATAFGLSPAQVRETASALASAAVRQHLRQHIGADRIRIAQAALEAAERAAGVAEHLAAKRAEAADAEAGPEVSPADGRS